ncbi:MAG: hypothetical protein Roseis2KO_26620 [Roseivirga sp.]
MKKPIAIFSLSLVICLLCISCETEKKTLSAKGYVRQLSHRDSLVAFIYEDNGKQGLIATTGDTLLRAKYDFIEDYVEYGLVMTDSGGYDASGTDYIHYETNKIGLIDYKGNILFEPQFDRVVFNGYPYALVKKGDKYGFINSKGKYVVELKYNYASPFFKIGSGFAIVENEDGYGVIDSTDRFVLPPIYDSLNMWYATGYSKDTMLVIINGHDSSFFINHEGLIFDL